MANIKIALIQMKVGLDKEENIRRAGELLDEAAEGADIAALPEMFNCPYSNDCFRLTERDILVQHLRCCQSMPKRTACI